MTRPAAVAPVPARPSGAVKVQVVINGKPGRLWDEMIGGRDGVVKFAPHGRYAYVARENGKPVLVIDDQPQESFDSVALDVVQFSQDGKATMYHAFRSGKLYVVVNGKQFGPYATVQGESFSADGLHTGWIAQKQLNGAGSVYIDGKEVATVDEASPLVLSPDGKRWAFLAKTSNGVVTRVMGVSPAEYAYFQPPIAFSPDGAHLLSEPPGQGLVVIDGKSVAHVEVKPPDRQAFAQAPWGPDGTVRCIGTGKTYLIQPDGTIAATLDGYATFSASGKRVVTRRLGQFDPNLGGMDTTIDLGGHVLTRYTNLFYEGFGPDDKYFFAATMKNGLTALVVEGTEWGAYTQAYGNLSFSDDGKYAATQTRQGGEWHLTVNGHDSAQSYEQVFPRTCGIEGNGARMMAVRAGQLLLIEAKLSGIEPLPAVNAKGSPSIAAPPPAVAPQAAKSAAARNWNRTVVIDDAYPGVGGAVAIPKAMVVGSDIVIVHTVISGRPVFVPTVSSRAAGKWTSLPVPDSLKDCRFVGSATDGKTLYVAMTEGYRGGAVRIVSRTGNSWKREWDMTSKAHFGEYVSMGVAGGQPFAIFADDTTPDASQAGRAAIAERTTEGKWTMTKLPLNYDPDIGGIWAEHVGPNPAVLLRRGGREGIVYGERVDGNWAFTRVASQSLMGNLIDLNGEPACFAENMWWQRAAGEWRSQPLADKADQIGSAAVAVVGGKPCVAYIDSNRGEVHFRCVVGSNWTDEVIDYAMPVWDTCLTMVEAGGKPLVAYIGHNGGVKSPLVVLEGS